LCSASLVFEPDRIEYAVMRIPYRSVTRLGRWSGALHSLLSAKADVFALSTSSTVLMKANNVNAPYQFVENEMEHRFSLQFEALQSFLPRVQELHYVHTAFSDGLLERDDALRAIVERRERAIAFDASWLENLSERPLKEVRAVLVTPLVTNPGRVMITNERLYFQPFNNINVTLVDKYALRDVYRIVKRRHTLRHVGIEVFVATSSAASLSLSSSSSAATSSVEPRSAFFAFSSRVERDAVYDLLVAQPAATNLQCNDQSNMTLRWQSGLISNFDYLMYVNNLAGRTTNDLTQYPVFPWVLADYESAELDLESPASYRDLSKPIGALNESRLASLRARYREIPDDQGKFLYGTHYSTPGYVLYFVVRQAPEFMLRLQNGKFDSPDRMFHSVADTWQGVLTSPADVKELIPEFYLPPADFLRNSDELELGTKQNSAQLGDVVLPPWARGDPQRFAELMRAALESEHVSQNLHHWIDLIFGYKQRGREAEFADNVFYPLTYEGVVDIDAIKDPRQRRAMEAQIAEFGQTPSQIFFTPHPARHAKSMRNSSSSSSSTPASTSSPSSSSLSLSSWSSPSASWSSTSLPSTNSSWTSASSISNWLLSGVTSSPSSSAAPAAAASGATSSSAADIDTSPSSSADSPANSIAESARRWSASLGSMKCSFEHRVHRDSVTSVALTRTDGGVTLYSVSQDSSLKIYALSGAKKQLRSINLSKLALSSVSATPEEKTVLVGSWDNNVYTYSVEFGRVLDTLTAHDDAVSALSLEDNTLFTGSWDSTVKMWKRLPTGIHKVPLADFVENEAEVRCVRIAAAQPNIAASATVDGVVVFFDFRTKRPIRTIHPHIDSVNDLHFTLDGNAVVTCSEDGHFKAIEVGGAETCSIDAGQPLLSLATDGDQIALATDSGSVEIWSLQGGSLVDTLEPAHSGPVRCVAVSHDGQRLVSGALDGTIKVWEQ
jgi:factor associated with neutral sphingomyelinase activation